MRICKACGFDRCDDLSTHCRQCGAKLSTPKQAEEEVHRGLAPAWFHYLDIPQVGTVELTPGQAFSIGRGERCDLRLTQIRSDRLASIFWSEGHDEATIERHGSAKSDEQVQVNDVRLSGTRTLKGNEEVSFGPVRMTYLKRARRILGAVQRKKGRIGLDPSRAVVREQGDGMLLEPRSRRFNRPAARAAAQKPTQRPPEQTPLERALRLEREQLTGVLRVAGPRGRGWVSVLSGAPTRALFNELRGEPAVAAILQQKQASCEFARGAAAPQGGGDVKVSFTTVEKKIERHRATTQRRAKPPPGPTWGDGAR